LAAVIPHSRHGGAMVGLGAYHLELFTVSSNHMVFANPSMLSHPEQTAALAFRACQRIWLDAGNGNAGRGGYACRYWLPGILLPRLVQALIPGLGSTLGVPGSEHSPGIALYPRVLRGGPMALHP